MDTIFLFGIFWAIYGIAGLLGVQIIPARYRGIKWTRSYIRQQGISWLLLGIPWLILWLTLDSSALDFRLKALLLIAVSLPAFFYTLWMDKAYRKRLKEES